jgi:hypothetical protein
MEIHFMKLAYFITNNWNSDTLDVNNQAWVNDGRCVFNSDAEVQEAISHREMIAPDEAGRLSVLSFEVYE